MNSSQLNEKKIASNNLLTVNFASQTTHKQNKKIGIIGAVVGLGIVFIIFIVLAVFILAKR